MKTATFRHGPDSPLIRAQKKAGLLADVFVNGALMRDVMAVSVNRRLVTIATRNSKGMVFPDSRRREIHKTQIVGDVVIEWRRAGK